MGSINTLLFAASIITACFIYQAHSRDVLDENNITECDAPFEGFGVHLGSITHFSKAKENVTAIVADLLYNDLELRHFRTSYEEDFSPSKNEYTISCRTPFSCAWNKMHKVMSKYTDIKIFASIWSPPHRMKNWAFMLEQEYELEYYYYVKNITKLIKETFNQTIELVSLINEPENSPAPWDHTNMGAHQLCRMVTDFNDSLVSGCPENSWYTISKHYMRHKKDGVDCQKVCKIILTHAYWMNFNPFSKNFLEVFYDPKEHKPIYPGIPHWQTEVCSTYHHADKMQMDDAMGLARNIVNFLGTTCVTRYYYWLSYTNSPSGESLIWGNRTTNELTFPKKYHVYRHFTQAARLSINAKVRRCDNVYFDGMCLQFGTGSAAAVFVNLIPDFNAEISIGCADLCCTTEEYDWKCGINGKFVPGYSVCSCKELIPNLSFEMEQTK